MDDYCKRSGQIPAFGDWDHANELPITQYFECARQAGLIRFSSSSGESNPCVPGDLYTVGLRKHSRNLPPARKQVSRVREKRGAPHVKEQKKGGRVCDVTEPPRKYKHQHPHHVPISNHNNDNSKSGEQLKNDVVPPKRLPVRPPKPVDEDLYKIPPELLHSYKRKKRPGFFSCLVPACAS
ncbi:hypothetical protein DITRI_Ditri20bG0047500 [Diplodiscus trichospermus]